LGPGTYVLINGASGAVGTAAVQLASIAGARVTAVCSGPNASLVRSLGATRVLDYTREDFTQTGTAYDVIVDCVGNVPFRQLQPQIKPGGALLSVISDLPGVLAAGLRSRRTGIHITAGNVPFIAADLAHVAQLAETGQFRPVMDRSFTLNDIAAAHRHVSTGRKRGNVVVQVAVPSTRRPSVETT
jgi:NADPH:quinone reductase-like Zn-dependent oxidoreductase